MDFRFGVENFFVHVFFKEQFCQLDGSIYSVTFNFDDGDDISAKE